jgi:hypothetical protein
MLPLCGGPELNSEQAEFCKLQRMTATEILLGLPPLRLQVGAEIKVENYRLHCNDQWKPKPKGFGHAYMTQDMKQEPI